MKNIGADRKILTRPRCPVNSGFSDITGESEDDHEELLAAVEAALNASNVASSGPFWKEMEQYFVVPTQDDLAYLKMQLNTPSASRSLSFSNQHAYLSSGNEDNDASGNFHGTQGIKASSGNYMADRWLDKALPLSQRLLAALIIEEDGENGTGIQDDRGQDEHSLYMSAFPCGTCSQVDTEPRDADRVEPEVSVESERTEGKCNVGPMASNGHGNYLSGINLRGNEPGEADILEHSEMETFQATSGNLDRVWRGQKNRNEQESCYQATGMVSALPAYDMQYQQMCLDDRILLELHHVGLFPEAMPDLSLREDDGIKEEIHKFQTELQQQVCKNKAQMYELEKAVFKRGGAEERKRECLAMNKLVEMAFNRHMGYRGTNASENKGAGTKAAKRATLAFVKRTLDRYRSFDVTGRSCFTEADLKEKLFCRVSREMHKEMCDDVTEGETLNINVNARAIAGPPDMKSSGFDNAGFPIACRIQNKPKGGREYSNACQADSLALEQIGAKHDSWSIKIKKKEVLLEDVGGNGTLKDAAVLGAKGKRSEREREVKGRSKESISKISNAKGGPHGMGNVKIERKRKTRLRQKMTQLSKAVNARLPNPVEVPKQSLSAGDKIAKGKDEFNMAGVSGVAQDLQCNSEGAIDLSHLQLPGMEVFGVNDGLDGQSQDLGSWFNLEDDVLQDAAGDCVGLDCPMDDLSKLALQL